MKPLRALLLLLSLSVLLCNWAGAHQITFSHLDVHLNPGGTAISVQLPVQALLQEVPTVLPAGTTPAMLRAVPLAPGIRSALGRMISARLRLASGSTALPLTVLSVAAAGEDVALSLTAPALYGEVDVGANLFPGDPLHKIFVSVYRGTVLAGQYALDRQAPSFTLTGPARPLWDTIVTFVREGVHHIYIGPDHILFVLALILLGGTLWSQAKIITAFTVAHSVTLTLAALNIVQLPSRLIESVIALSIVVVGLHDLRQLRLGVPVNRGLDLRVLFAFAFGLVHGFGFASVLRDLDLPVSALAWSLASFNVGVEIGQVSIVLLAAPLLFALRRSVPARTGQGVLTGLAGAVVVMGGYWLVQRALGA